MSRVVHMPAGSSLFLALTGLFFNFFCGKNQNWSITFLSAANQRLAMIIGRCIMRRSKRRKEKQTGQRSLSREAWLGLRVRFYFCRSPANGVAAA